MLVVSSHFDSWFIAKSNRDELAKTALWEILCLKERNETMDLPHGNGFLGSSRALIGKAVPDSEPPFAYPVGSGR